MSVGDSKHPAPHDRFFAAIFERPEALFELLESTLDADIVAMIDRSSLVCEKESFVDDDLSKRYSDLLCSFALNLPPGEGGADSSLPTTTDAPDEPTRLQLYLLIDHKSDSDRFTTLQLLGYLVRIYERQRKSGATRLAPVLPLLFYQTSDDTYHPARNFVDACLVELPTGLRERLQPHLPDYTPLHFETTAETLQQLDNRPLLYFTARLMRHIRDLGLDLVEEAIRHFPDQKDLALLALVVHYTLRVREESSEVVIATIIRALPELEEEIMTAADQLEERGVRRGIEKGRVEGKLEGLQEGKLETARSMAADGHDAQFIARYTGLSEAELREHGVIE